MKDEIRKEEVCDQIGRLVFLVSKQILFSKVLLVSHSFVTHKSVSQKV